MKNNLDNLELYDTLIINTVKYKYFDTLRNGKICLRGPDNKLHFFTAEELENALHTQRR